MGAELVAISPQIQSKNLEIQEKQNLTFPILSDPGNQYAKSLAIVHQLPEDLRPIYLSFGISLPEHNGDESWELPLPTRMVIDKENRILDVATDPDYTSRPEPEETLKVLRAL